MPSLPPPSVTPTIEEKLAKLCVRPHLSSDVLPRFVLTMLECALHSFLCSFAACIMEIIGKYRRGELEPWPDEPENDALTTRIRTSKMKPSPAAPQRSAGATPVRMTPAAIAEAGCDACQAVIETRLGWATQQGALLHNGYARRLRPAALMRRWRGDWPQADRCRPAAFFSAAEMRRKTCV